MQNNPFTYCPNCSQKELEFTEEKKISCPRCGFVFYLNVAGATAVVLSYANKILLVRRNQEPQKGKLDLPGGFVDPGESAESGLIREVKEELDFSLRVENLRFIASEPNIYLYKNISYATLDVYFEYKLDEFVDFQPNKKEIKQLEWIEIQNIPLEELAFDSHKNFFLTHTKRLLW